MNTTSFVINAQGLGKSYDGVQVQVTRPPGCQALDLWFPGAKWNWKDDGHQIAALAIWRFNREEF